MRVYKFIHNLFIKKNKIDYLMQVINKSNFRYAVRNIVDVINRNEIIYRRTAASLHIPKPHPELIDQLNSNGWVMLPSSFSSEIRRLVEEEVLRLEKNYSAEGVSKVRYKSMWQYLTDQQQFCIDESSHLVKLALDREILAIVSSYLKSMPWLRDVMITKSVYVPGKNNFSQKWHLDYDDVRMLKLFMYLSDVDDIGDGPFTVLSLESSGAFKNTFIPEHLDDDVFFRKTSRVNTLPIYGKKLSMFLVDTSRLYHQGSRLLHDRSRILYTALYTGYPSIYNYAIRNKSIHLSRDASDLERMIISPETHI